MAMKMVAIVVLLLGVMVGAEKDVHEVLVDHGFPVGVLPDIVEWYKFNKENKALTIGLNKSECRVYTRDVYETDLELRYGENITAKLYNSELKEVTGIEFRYPKSEDKFSSVSRMVMDKDQQGVSIYDKDDVVVAFVPNDLLKSIPSCDNTNKEIRRFLVEYGLPVGLFPDGVKWYNFNEEYLTVGLDKSECQVNISGLEFRYEENITGEILFASKGLNKIKGIQWKKHINDDYEWLNVSDIQFLRLYISIFVYDKYGGLVHVPVPVDLFDTIPSCHDASSNLALSL